MNTLFDYLINSKRCNVITKFYEQPKISGPIPPFLFSVKKKAADRKPNYEVIY